MVKNKVRSETYEGERCFFPADDDWKSSQHFKAKHQPPVSGRVIVRWPSLPRQIQRTVSAS